MWFAGFTVPGVDIAIVQRQGGIMLSNVWLLAKPDLSREKLLAEKRAGRQTMEMTNTKLWFYYIQMADGTMRPLSKVMGLC